jgi:hypothetical protein
MASMDTGDPIHSDEWWVGFLSASIAKALRHRPLEGGRPILDRALRDFRQSPACTKDLRPHLRRERA